MLPLSYGSSPNWLILARSCSLCYTCYKITSIIFVFFSWSFVGHEEKGWSWISSCHQFTKLSTVSEQRTSKFRITQYGQKADNFFPSLSFTAQHSLSWLKPAYPKSLTQWIWWRCKAEQHTAHMLTYAIMPINKFTKSNSMFSSKTQFLQILGFFFRNS